MKDIEVMKVTFTLDGMTNFYSPCHAGCREEILLESGYVSRAQTEEKHTDVMTDTGRP